MDPEGLLEMEAVPAEELVTHPVWEHALDQIAGRTTLLVGSAGTGKTRFARFLAEQAPAEAGAVALVTSDMGQPSVGVPMCLAASLGPRWDEPAALWFIGETTPRSHLLPTVVGAGRLAERMRQAGARTLLIDTTGWVEGPVARVLKYHKLLATGADQVFALQRSGELEPLLDVLQGICRSVLCVPVVGAARDRSAVRRKAGREMLYRVHFAGGSVSEFPVEWVIDTSWQRVSPAEVSRIPVGTAAGLLDPSGFCLGLGLVEGHAPDAIKVFTGCTASPGAVRSLQLGPMRLDRSAGFSEL